MRSNKVKNVQAEKGKKGFSPLRSTAERMLQDIDFNQQEFELKDFKAIFQELQVHQIELEMQNDELRLVNLELEQQKARFSAIYDDAPVGYFVLDQAGVIQDVNSTGLRLIHALRKGKVIGTRLSKYISPEDSDDYYRFFMHMLNSREAQKCELRLEVAENTTLFTRFQGTVKPGDDEKIECYIAVVDITDRKRFEQQLAETKERLELSLKASLAGTWELDLSTMDFFLDESSNPICNFSPGKFIGSLNDFINLAHPQDRKDVEDKFRTSINSNKEVDIICRFGGDEDEECYLEIRGHTIQSDGRGKRVVGIIMDITEKTRIENYSRLLLRNQRNKIAAATLLTEENERRRISGVLHDSVSQLLYGIKMKLRQVGKEKDAFGEIKAINSLLDEAISETRDISFELAPSILTDFGLAATVEELANKLSSKALQIAFKSFGLNKRMSLLLETNVYRITQELINNVMKHSGANKINITIRKNKFIEIIVQDNGSGFPVGRNDAATSGSGLSSIKNRLALYNGKLDIKSIPGSGTTVHIKLSESSPE